MRESSRVYGNGKGMALDEGGAEGEIGEPKLGYSAIEENMIMIGQ